MAVHPKHSMIGALLLGGIALGLILFMLGRMTAGADLTRWLVGVAVGLVIIGAAGIGLVRHLPESQRFEGMLHKGAASSEEGFVSARARTELVGQTGIAASELRPAGVAEIAGERVDVTTEGDWIRSGTPVVVVHAEGMKVVVRPAPQLGAGASTPRSTS
jgi:membrane-bound serine protease (ClpP class)